MYLSSLVGKAQPLSAYLVEIYRDQVAVIIFILIMDLHEEHDTSVQSQSNRNVPVMLHSFILS